MKVEFKRAKKARKCHTCGQMVPKGTCMLMHYYFLYRRSQWITEEAHCFNCMIEQMEKVNPRAFDLAMTERVIEKEGMVDVA